MKNWHKTLVTPTTSIHDTIRCIDSSAMQIALVTDDKRKLLGIVTDGDVRRAILKGIALDQPVAVIMNRQPVTARAGTSDPQLLADMRRRACRHLPVTDEEGRLVRLAVLDELLQPEVQDNWVVLMAGGLGTRLRPLTDDSPKPLLKVGDKPLLETIIENFRGQGFNRFFLSVNYKAEMIQDYFGDGSRLEVEIRYLHETQRLGTAGALTLLPEPPPHPFIVMNADLLTKVDYRALLDFHREHGAQATMCVREYDFQVPYGVVQLDGQRIKHIQEKPVQRFFVNAGIYVLEPEVLTLIPPQCFFDMPSVFNTLHERDAETCAFPIREYWIDIGRMADLERANSEFGEVFQ